MAQKSAKFYKHHFQNNHTVFSCNKRVEGFTDGLSGGNPSLDLLSTYEDMHSFLSHGKFLRKVLNLKSGIMN